MTIQLRVFDALAAAKQPTSLRELETLLPFDERTIRQALIRLRVKRCVTSQCVDSVWRFEIRQGAARPHDGRGKGLRL